MKRLVWTRARLPEFRSLFWHFTWCVILDRLTSLCRIFLSAKWRWYNSTYLIKLLRELIEYLYMCIEQCPARNSVNISCYFIIIIIIQNFSWIGVIPFCNIFSIIREVPIKQHQKKEKRKGEKRSFILSSLKEC